MDIRKVKKLIELAKATDISELEIKEGEETVKITLNKTIPLTAEYQIAEPQIFKKPENSQQEETIAIKPSVEPQNNSHIIHAPMVGTVYLASSPGAKPFVDIGQQVNPGDTICIIEAMKMFNKIETDKAGVIGARLIEDADHVEYEQPLFIIN